MIIAIDGPAGSGKGTIANHVAKDFGFVNIDTGATFRCVTLSIIKRKIDLDEKEKIEELLNEIDINLVDSEDGLKVYLNNEDVSKEIRTNEVNALVSEVSKLPIVRENLLSLQRRMAEGKNVVMEGRDIGTTVFPNADVKIFLTASAEERARRRVVQNLEKGIETTYEEALENVLLRDKIDSEREISPLRKADDAIEVDCTDASIEINVAKVEKVIREKLNLG